MQVTNHRRFDNFSELAAQRENWTRLLRRSDTDKRFMSFSWIEAWWRHAGSNYDLNVYFLYDQSQLIGIFPLIRRQKEGFRQLAIAGVGRSEYLDFILDPAYRDVCIRYFLDQVLPNIPDWDLFHCTRLLEDRPNTEALINRMQSQSRYKFNVQDFAVAPYLMVEGTWEDYQTTIKYVRSTRKERGRLERKYGCCDVITPSSEAEVDAWLDRLIELHKFRRDEVKKDYSIFNDEQVIAFYRAAARQAFAEGWLHFTALKVGDDLAALHLGFLADGALLYAFPVIDMTYDKYSVGRILLFALLEEAFEKAYALFDFGYGAESYKYVYTQTERTMKEVVLVNRSTRGQLAHLWYNGIRNRVKENALFMEKVLPRLKMNGMIKEMS